MLKLMIGRAGTGKTSALLRAIAEEGRAREQLLIVPEQHSHAAERSLCAAAGNAVSLRAEVLSFTRLASRVFSVSGGLAVPVLDAGGRLLLMDVALHQVSDRLKLYARPSRKPQFLNRLAATVDECKSCNLTPEKLTAVAGQAGGETADKLYDLALICAAYDALTAQRGTDPRDRLTRLAGALEESRWAEGRDVWLDCFTDFTPQERLVLDALLRQARSVTVALTCDSLSGGAEVFAPARRTALQLLAMARKNGVTAQVETLRAGPGRAFAEAVPVLEPFWGPFLPGGRVELYRAGGPYAEVERAAGEIARLVREEGWRWRDIQVTARSMDGLYGELVSLIFPRYGIPVFLSKMDDILQKPVLLLVVSALDVVAEEYRYEDVFRYLKTGLTGLSPDEVDELENYVLKWNIKGSRWTQKAPWRMHPEGYGVQWTDEDREKAARLDDLRRSVAAPLGTLRGERTRTGRGLALALYRFLEELGLAQRLADRARELEELGEAALALEYQQLWDILCAALEQCADLLGDTPMDWDEFSRLLRLVLSQYSVGAIPVSLDQVTAGDMQRLAHKHCKALFVLGADDGNLPAAAPSPGLLADADREVLARFGLESAPRLTEKLWREFTIAYEACSLPTRRLIVSYPALGTGGEERRPSFLVRALRRAMPELTALDEARLGGEFRLWAPRPALELAGWESAAADALREDPRWAPLVARMERARGMERGSLTRPTVEALYGRRVPMSASRMDRYKSCHFSYFMQYGLKAKPRKSAGFQAPEYGTFVHYVLEHVIRERRGKELPTREEVSAVVERYVQEELGGLEGETPRFRYLFRRLERSVYAVVENVCEELARSQFEPVAFELGFGHGKTLPPVELTVDGMTVSVSGFVDRVDGWVRDDRLYLRVVDYKTGRKSFDLTDVWNGLGLQMLLYLFTLQKEGKTLFGREAEPAGVLYLPARDAVVAGSRAMTEEERQKKIDAQLRRSGLLLDDAQVLEAMEGGGEIRFLPVKLDRSGAFTGQALVSAERFGKLQRHIERILRDVAAELAAGNIAADPFWRGPDRNACRWCDYADACQFQEGCGGDRRRWLPSVKAETFWADIEKEPDGDDD